jgi:large subunit ribosomal protein L9
MSKKNVEVILQRSVRGCGKCGQVVKVRRGYAMYMDAQGYSVFATKENIERNKLKLASLQSQDQDRHKNAQRDAAVLQKLAVCFVRSAGAQGKLYGSVSVGDLAEEIKLLSGIELQRNQVSMEVARTTGWHHARLHLFESVEVDMKFHVAESEAEKSQVIAGINAAATN